jgi:hypothetical protein
MTGDLFTAVESMGTISTLGFNYENEPLLLTEGRIAT